MEEKKEKFHKKAGYGKYRGDKEKKIISSEEIEKKTAVNAENFPPLVSNMEIINTNIFESLSPEKNAKKEKEAEREKENIKEENSKENKRIKYSRHDLVDLFKKLSDNLKPNEILKHFSADEIPVLELNAKPELEFINPTVIKREVRTTPKTIPLTPKQQPK